MTGDSEKERTKESDSQRKKKTTTAPARLQAANTKPYRKLITFVIRGVKNPIRKFQIQLADVARAPCFALDWVGNVSPTRIQMAGPQVMAYPAMKKHAETIMTFFVGHGEGVRMDK